MKQAFNIACKHFNETLLIFDCLKRDVNHRPPGMLKELSFSIPGGFLEYILENDCNLRLSFLFSYWNKVNIIVFDINKI